MTKPNRAATRSPVALARTAYQVAQAALPAYFSDRSRKDFTQAQLFACLVLMEFFRTDFRGVVAYLNDFAELRRILKFTDKVPHYSTLCRAKKPGKTGAFELLMDQAVAQAGRQGLISDKPEGVVDATGLSADGRSSYYAHKLQRSKGSTHGGSKSTRYPMLKWPKINAIADTHSHLFIAASVSEGPSHDSPELPELLEQASGRVKFDRFLADAGYDSEEHHRLAREEHGIRSTVIALNKRNQGQKWPKTKYRRQMKRNFHIAIYGNRSQIESIWSRHKRRLGWVLSSKSDQGQVYECQNRIMTHNLMLLAA